MQLARQKHLINDWGGLTRYGSENTELRALKPGAKRVVFFGDQITELWGNQDSDFFCNNAWLNRGIAGQTTSQMLVRFRQDVVSINANAVVILAGTNDRRHTRPFDRRNDSRQPGIHGGYCEAAWNSGGASSIPPVCDCSGKTPFRQRWQERIEEANDLIRDYATHNHAIYADFYSVLAEGRNLKADLTSDGVLLNRAAYAAMAPIARRAIEDAFRKQ